MKLSAITNRTIGLFMFLLFCYLCALASKIAIPEIVQSASLVTIVYIAGKSVKDITELIVQIKGGANEK